jgi:hypothetical protein
LRVYQRQESPQAVIHLSIALGQSPYATAYAGLKAKFFAHTAAALFSAMPGKCRPEQGGTYHEFRKKKLNSAGLFD